MTQLATNETAPTFPLVMPSSVTLPRFIEKMHAYSAQLYVRVPGRGEESLLLSATARPGYLYQLQLVPIKGGLVRPRFGHLFVVCRVDPKGGRNRSDGYFLPSVSPPLFLDQ